MSDITVDRINPEEHVPLVYYIVHRIAKNFPSFIDRDDLAQAGMIGLMEASKRYDSDSDVPFASYAGRRIEGAIYDFVRADSWTPRQVKDLQKRLESLEAQAALEEISLSEEEISERLQISKARLSEVRASKAKADVISLDAPVSPTGEFLMRDILTSTGSSPEDSLISAELSLYLSVALELLSERHRSVLVMYYCDELPLAVIASELNVGVSRASSIKQTALERLTTGVLGQFEVFTEEPRNSFERGQRDFIEEVAAAARLRRKGL